MKTYCFLVLASVIFTILCEIQYFQAKYEASNTNFGRDAIISADGSVLMTGNSNGFNGIGCDDIVVSKFTKAGAGTWTTAFGYSGATDHCKGHGIAETSDGIFVVGEGIKGSEISALVLKLDSNGVLENQISYRSAGDAIFYGVVDDGNDIVAVGVSQNGSLCDGLIVKLKGDATGYLWQTTIDGDEDVLYLYKIIKVSDGDYVVLGTSGSDIQLVKIDKDDGSKVWFKKIMNATLDVSGSTLLEETSTKNIIISGNTENDKGFICSIASNGTGIQWNYELNDVTGRISGLTELEDGSFFGVSSDGEHISFTTSGTVTSVKNVENEEYFSLAKSTEFLVSAGQYNESEFSVTAFSETGMICGTEDKAVDSTEFDLDINDCEYVFMSESIYYDNETDLTTRGDVIALEPEYLCVDCEDEYFGDICNETTCLGIWNYELDEVCYGHGDCVDYNECKCDEFYYSEFCNITQCFNILQNYSSSCNGEQGECIGYNDCKCNYTWSGDECDSWECYGYDKSNSSVCQSGGICEKYNYCDCDEGYGSDFEGGDCIHWNCSGYYKTNRTGCSNNGTCVGADKCECDYDFLSESKFCESFWCFGYDVEDSEHVCTGRGSCVEGNVCECDADVYGPGCEVAVRMARFSGSLALIKMYYSVLVSSLPATPERRSNVEVVCADFVYNVEDLGSNPDCYFTTIVKNEVEYTGELIINPGSDHTLLDGDVLSVINILDGSFINMTLYVQIFPEAEVPIEGTWDAFTIAFSTGMALLVILVCCLFCCICYFFLFVYLIYQVILQKAPIKDFFEEKKDLVVEKVSGKVTSVVKQIKEKRNDSNVEIDIDDIDDDENEDRSDGLDNDLDMEDSESSEDPTDEDDDEEKEEKEESDD